MVDLFPGLRYDSPRRHEIKKALNYIKRDNPCFLTEIYKKDDAEEILSALYPIDKNSLDLKDILYGEEILEIASQLETKLKNKHIKNSFVL